MKEEVVSRLNGVVYKILSCSAVWDLFWKKKSTEVFTVVRLLSDENIAA